MKISGSKLIVISLILITILGCSKKESKYPTAPASATALTNSSGVADLDFGSHFITVSVVNSSSQPVSNITIIGHLLKDYLYILAVGNDEYYSNHMLVPYSEMDISGQIIYGPKPASPQTIEAHIEIVVTQIGGTIHPFSDEPRFQDDILSDEWVNPVVQQGSIPDILSLAQTLAIDQNVIIHMTDNVASLTNPASQTIAMVIDSAEVMNDTTFSAFIGLEFHIVDPDTLSLTYVEYQSDTIPVIFISDIGLASDNFFAQFILTWGEFPQDLDAHLWTPEIEGFPYHVYFGNPGDLSAAPYAFFDMDADTGWGPERIVIGQAFPGTYYYSVHHYSGESNIPASGAVVSLLKHDRSMQEFTPPDSAGTGEGWYWHVCTIDGTAGDVTEIGTMTQSPPVTAGYPKDTLRK